MENWIKYSNQKIREESKNPEISIGLPIYNSEKFIRKRLENILSQTFNDFELIISDNASTDDSVKICKEFMEKDSRIKLYVQDENPLQLDEPDRVFVLLLIKKSKTTGSKSEIVYISPLIVHLGKSFFSLSKQTTKKGPPFLPSQ